MQELFKSSVPKIKALRVIFMARCVISVSLRASNAFGTALTSWPHWAEASGPTHLPGVLASWSCMLGSTETTASILLGCRYLAQQCRLPGMERGGVAFSPECSDVQPVEAKCPPWLSSWWDALNLQILQQTQAEGSLASTRNDILVNNWGSWQPSWAATYRPWNWTKPTVVSNESPLMQRFICALPEGCRQIQLMTWPISHKPFLVINCTKTSTSTSLTPFQ